VPAKLPAEKESAQTSSLLQTNSVTARAPNSKQDRAMTEAQFIQPVFQFLDNAIQEYGDYLYMGLVFSAIALIGWILSGGLRRKRPQLHSFISIFVVRPSAQPSPISPPMIRGEREPFSGDDEDSFSV
jgi:hypothetical protein